MRILFINRQNCFSQRGGDTVQMEKTKEFLEKLYSNIEITIVHSPEEILKDNEAQIVHIFNMTNTYDVVKYIKAATQTNKKIILTPIYYDTVDGIYVKYLKFFGIFGKELPNIYKKFIIVFLNLFVKFLSFFIKKYTDYTKNGLYLQRKNKNLGIDILKNSNIILPNSDKELSQIEEYFNLQINKKTQIIPNATEFFNLAKNSNCNDFNIFLPDDFVLEVGRIEIIKNQLNLIKALMYDSEIPIVIVGKIFNDKYCASVKKYASKRGNVYIYDEIPHQYLYEIYRKARVHVLPSFVETTGLVTIEAKSAGTQVVTSEAQYCPIEYYQFDKLGFQCNPYKLDSIRNAVLEAYYHPKKTELTEEYKQFFSYENVAKMTHDAYLKVLGK